MTEQDTHVCWYTHNRNEGWNKKKKVFKNPLFFYFSRRRTISNFIHNTYENPWYIPLTEINSTAIYPPLHALLLALVVRPHRVGALYFVVGVKKRLETVQTTCYSLIQAIFQTLRKIMKVCLFVRIFLAFLMHHEQFFCDFLARFCTNNVDSCLLTNMKNVMKNINQSDYMICTFCLDEKKLKFILTLYFQSRFNFSVKCKLSS